MSVFLPTRLGLFLAAAITMGGCSSFERQMVFPGAATQGKASAIVPPSSHYELLTLTSRDGTRVTAQFGCALDHNGAALIGSDAAPTILYFYGNGSSLANSAEIFEGLRQLGANVLMPEYPGYGMSGGEAGEHAFYAAADAAYDHLLNQAHVNPKRLVVAGWSMGGGVAIDLANRRPVAGLVTLSAFTSLPDVAKKITPWLPVSLLLRTRFDNASKIGAISCPILLLHGERDGLVPPAMADRLAATARPGNVRVLKIPEAAHNDVFFAGGAATWEALRDFIHSSTGATK